MAVVEWIPGLDDRLMVCTADLKLFRIRSGCPAVAPPPGSMVADSGVTMQIGPDSVAELECQVPDPPTYIRCCQVVPRNFDDLSVGAGSDIRFGVGQNTGKISLVSFDEVNHGIGRQSPHVVKEFGPRVVPRVNNEIAFNVKRPNILAAGYEKNKNDHAILIFDTESPTPAPVVNLARADVNAGPDNLIGPLTEIGQGDACQSLAWFREMQPDVLISGINFKNLKAFDTRCSGIHSGRASLTSFTRSVHGVCVDPFLDFRLASHHDSQVAIWDTRNFEKPIVTLQQKKKVSKLAWSPTRSGLLASLVEDGTFIRLHDIQSWAVMSEDGDPAVIERDVHSYSQFIISGFDWHPNYENVLVVASKTGRLSSCKVNERLTPSWSNRHDLVWPQGGNLKICAPSSSVFDVSIVMEERAKAGVFSDKMTCATLDQVDQGVVEVFKWVEWCRTLMEDPIFKNQFPKNSTYPGVRTALGLDRLPAPSAICSDITYCQWNGHYGYGVNSLTPEPETSRPKRIYRGQQRERCLRIIAWGADDTDLKRRLEFLEKDGSHTRAAMIAIFCLQINTAAGILKRGGDWDNKDLSVVAMALSGFSEEKSGTVWREMVADSYQNMVDPFLRVMFMFLLQISSPDPNFSCILKEEIQLSDKIGFCCLHMSDAALISFVNASWASVLDEVDLSSFYLCGGSSHETVQLLQRLVDATGNVQTASWVAAKTLPSDLVESEMPQQWIQSYRELMDAWGLFDARAELDNAIGNAGASNNSDCQIFIACNYCNTTICRNESLIMKHLVNPVVQTNKEDIRYSKRVNLASSKATGINQNQNQLARYQSASSACLQGTIKAETCPSCKKPLPRCAVCFLNLGSLSGLIRRSGRTTLPGGPKKLTNFDNFFTWCQRCHHGGHVGHMQGWFKDNIYCPAHKCGCKCAALDPSTKLGQVSLENSDKPDSSPKDQRINGHFDLPITG